ncbi:ubiquitin-ribosomal protein eL40 fusion protein-like [Glandiceps talaboti]
MDLYANSWQICVSGVTESGGNIIIELNTKATVDDLMRKISGYSSLPVDSWRIIYGGQEIHHLRERRLSDYGVGDYSTLTVVQSGRSDSEWRVKILRECPKKIISSVSNCPTFRACPTCTVIIEHESGCREMVCRCGLKFCFICLKTAARNSSLPCGGHSTGDIAPLQC